MRERSPLYNVNRIVVPRESEQEYIQFSKTLNRYLREKYKKYYITLQLYQSNQDSTLFYVIAAYWDVPGVEIAAVQIGNEIGEIYDYVWDDEVQRISIFRFLDYTRVIPPQIY